MQNSKVFLKRTIENNPFYMAPVEIIVPFYGEHSRVSKLIDSVFKTVHNNRYLISLVDDGSKNNYFVKYIERAKLPGVRCLVQENKGFGSAVNLALKNPWNKGLNIDWVVIAHSDVFFEDANWLYNLGKSFNELKDKGVRMISPLTNNPVSPSSVLFGNRGEQKEDVIFDEYLPMYCALTHRDLFNQIGLLKEYPYAGFEVEEFAARMKNKGYKQAVCGSSWVNHHGSATIKNLSQDQNAQKTMKKIKEDFENSISKA